MARLMMSTSTPAIGVKSNLAVPVFPSSWESQNLSTSSKAFFKCRLSSVSSSTSLLASNKSTMKSRSIICKASEAINEVQVVTETSWESLVIGSTTPVLVEFWAPWCGPCRMIAPVIDELAKEYSGKIACYKLNTDDSPNIATKYGIRSIPTVLFFNNGERKESIIGAVPKSTLESSIEKYLD